MSRLTVIDAAAYVAAAETLMAQCLQKEIPYVKAGMSLTGMDCQGLCEYLLMQCGISKQTVNLAGSNAHWRRSLKWRGTPEEAVRLFGCVPAGAWIFIWSEAETDKYAGDGEGNASHMGVYMGGGRTLNASGSAEKVCVSTKFAGKKSVPNGGWNRVGLPKWVRYSDDIERKLGTAEQKGGTAMAIYDARVVTSGGHLNLRSAPRQGGTDIGDIPNGGLLQVLEETGAEWVKVIWEGMEGYVMRRYISQIIGGETEDASDIPVTTDAEYGIYIPCASYAAANALKRILSTGVIKSK